MIAGLSYTVQYQTGLCGYRRMYGRGVVMMASEVIKELYNRRCQHGRALQAANFRVQRDRSRST